MKIKRDSYQNFAGFTPSDMTVEFSSDGDNSVHITIAINDDHVISHTVVWCYGTSFCEVRLSTHSALITPSDVVCYYSQTLIT